jgi:Raf kinase inhibitor-like YbhB/YbcL family protein
MIIFIIVIIVVSMSGVFFLNNKKNNNIIISPNSMKLESSAFINNEIIPLKYTCDGENINPPLTISNAPKDAKTFILIMDDPDAPMGTWVHWTMWNIPYDTKEITERFAQQGAVEGLTSFGDIGYGGPCPQSGTHKYSFRIYAINKTIDLDSGATPDELKEKMGVGVVDSAELIGLYKRR